MRYYSLTKCFAPIFYLVASLLPGSAYTQVSRQWVQFYDGFSHSGNRKLPIVTDDYGNAYVTGTANPITNVDISNISDYVTIKYNSSGTAQWLARYDGFGGHDEPMGIAVDHLGNVYVTGTSTGDETGSDFATIKYNSAGVQQWVARFNSYGSSLDYAADIKVDKEGNVYVTGSSAFNNLYWNFATVKYNQMGVQQWVRYYDTTAKIYGMAWSVALDPVTSDIYVIGSSSSIANTGRDFTVVKYNLEGNEEWARSYNSSGSTNDDPTDIALDAQGNIYVTGISGSLYASSTSTLIKYNRSGAVQWIVPYSHPGSSVTLLTDMVVDRFNNVYVTGATGQSELSCLTIKYNSEGAKQWTQLYHAQGNAGFNRSEDISLDNEGNIYIAGFYAANRYATGNFLAIKYDPNGAEKWVRLSYDLPTSEAVPQIAVNKFNDVFLSGFIVKYTGASTYHFEFGTIKYVQPKPLIVTASPDTTVYYGYGSNCVQLKAEVSGGVAPYTFTWLPGGSKPNNVSTIVCPTATTVYKVVVKDAVGTTDTAQVTVKVIDVRCGDKVIVCHNGKELCIASQAVDSHLKHGDKLGSCSLNANDCDKLKDITSWKGELPLIFKAYPNPFSHVSTIVYQLPIDAQVSITIVDVYGREIKTLIGEKKRAGYYFVSVDGKKLVPGTYLCKMVISAPPCQSVQMLKLIVTR